MDEPIPGQLTIEDCIEDTKPKGWPDKCHRCGAHWSMVGFDYALGFNCRKCGGSDADE